MKDMKSQAGEEKGTADAGKEWERLVNINTPPVCHLIQELPVEPQHEKLQKEIVDRVAQNPAGNR